MWAPFAQLILQDSEAYFSDFPWRQGIATYEARVIQWDVIERSIPAVAGLAQHSNTRVRLQDTDRVIRDMIGSYTFRRRTCKIYLAQSGGTPILDSEPIFTGEVHRIRLGEAWVELELRDTLFGWIDEEFPALITPDLFPSFPITEPVFAPVLFGHLVAADGQGCVPLPHIGVIDSPPVADRWVIACHEVHDVISVYKKSPGEGAFSLVDPSLYEINTETATVYDIPVTFTFLDFIGFDESPPTAPLPEGTEIAIDVDGINARGEWGALPAVSGHLRNPIDYFINVAFFFQAKSGRLDTSEIWDTDAIGFLRERCEPSGDNFCLCRHAILGPITMRQFTGQFLTSFEFFIHQQQSTVGNPGTLTMGILNDSGTGQHLSEVGVINAGTFAEEVGEPSFNEVLTHYSKNYRINRFEQQRLIANDDEQGMIGVIDGSPEEVQGKAERDSVELPMIYEEASALLSISRRLNFLSFGSYRQTFTVPLPGRATVLEPGKSAFISHRLGVQIGGYVEREVKILRVTLDVGQLAANVETILREPIRDLARADIIRVFYDISGTGNQQVYRAALTGVIDGSNRVFTLPDMPLSNSEEIFINGWPQFGLYRLSSATVTFDYPPQIGDVIDVFYDISGSGNEPRYRVTPTGTVDGTNDTFTLPESPVTNSERVYINNFMQVQGVAYDMGSPPGGTITFFPGYMPQTGDQVRVWYDISGGSRPRRRHRIFPRGLVNNVNTRFVILEDAIADSEQVFNNFVFQRADEEYEFIGTRDIEFAIAPRRS